MTGTMATSETLPHIRLKRAYEPASDDDGPRLLVERLWPRGVRRDEVRIDRWFKSIAPSPDLRRWYDHIPGRWPEFRRRYLVDLTAAGPELDDLLDLCRAGPVTFVFAARDEARNSAVVLRDHVLKRLAER